MTWRAISVFVFVSCTGLLGASGQDRCTFADVTTEAGIEFRHRFGDDKLSNIVEGTGAGAMFFDYNGDGWLDLYLLSGCWLREVNDNRGRKYKEKLSNRLYRNEQNGTFVDVTKEAGVGDKGFSAGCSAADYDGDGDLDLYVLNYGKNVFYRNNGDDTFSDVSDASGLANAAWSLSAPWFDYDNDGDPDVYVVNYLNYDGGEHDAYYPAKRYPGPLAYSGRPDVLYRNNGDGTFSDVTKDAGVFNPDGRGMSATVADLDNDGKVDIYVANDSMENFFYRNRGDGTFEDLGLERGLAFGEGGQGVSSMGPTVGDVDRDGWLDVYIPDMGYGCLLMNREGFFDDRTTRAKLAVVCGQYTGWGAVLFDVNNDGYLDVFVANGNAHWEFPEEDVLLQNDGTGNYIDIAASSGPYFKSKHVGRGAVCGDYDNDGDLDLFVVNLNDTPKLLRNEGGNRNHWLQVDARLAGGQRSAVGARVTVRAGGRTQIQELSPVTGYLSQIDSRIHFGLGRAEKAELVEIRWPDGRQTQLKDVAMDQVLQVVQDAK